MTYFENAYLGRRVLVTGHTGFKGSWLSTWLESLGAEVAGFSIDIPTTPSNLKVISTTDFQGKRCKPQKNMPYLNIYQDGRVEKRVVVE